MIIPPPPAAMRAAMNSIYNLENQVTRVVVGHCKDCKWWGDYGVCKNEKLTHSATSSKDGLWPTDDDACFGSVTTGPLFSCCHFEQKVESTQTQ